MSQINDALKRAEQAPEPPPLPGAGAPPPLPTLPSSAPVGGFRTIPPPPASSGLQLPVIVVSAALVFIVALAAFLVVRGFSRKTSTARRNSVERSAATEKGAPAKSADDSDADLDVAKSSTPTAKPATAKPATPVVARQVPAPTATASVVAPTNRAVAAIAGTNGFPPLKVQGIFFRARNPSAVVNGKSVFVGDHMAGGVTIVAITADSVTVEANGNKKTLTLY